MVLRFSLSKTVILASSMNMGTISRIHRSGKRGKIVNYGGKDIWKKRSTIFFARVEALPHKKYCPLLKILLKISNAFLAWLVKVFEMPGRFMPSV
jgi:hypothetical protein